MKSLLTLLRANLKRKKGAFKSIAALMAMIALSFSGTVSNDDNLMRELSKSYENYDVGDILITLSEDALTDDIKNELNNNPDVVRWKADEMIAVNSSVKIDGAKQDLIARIQRIDDKIRVFNETNDGFMDSVSLSDNEVLISYSFAKFSGFEKGDNVEFETENGTEQLKISGLIEDPIYGCPTIAGKKFIVNDSTYSRFCSEMTDNISSPFKYFEKVYMIHIFNSGSMTDTELSSQLNDNCGIIDKKMLYITKNELTEVITLYANVGTKLLAVYVFLLTLVVIITIHNSISSSIEMDYADIGILKSQGFTAWQIRICYMMQYSMSLIIGAAIGTILSVPLLKYLGEQFVLFTDILTHGEISVVKCILISMLIIIICSISVVISSSRVSKISPVKALNGGHEDVYFSNRMNVQIRKKPLVFFVALRQITSRIGVYAGTALITALLVFFMMSIIIMTGGLSSEIIFGDMDNIRVSMLLFDGFSKDDMEDMRNKISSVDDNAQVYFSSHYDINLNNIIYGADITDNIELLAKIYDGRVPEYSNEIAVTEIVSDEIGKRIGDTVTLHTDGCTEEYIITGLYQTTTEFGRTFIMNYNAAEKLNIPVQSAYVILPEKDDNKTEQILDMLDSSFSSKLIAEEFETDSIYSGSTDSFNNLLNVVVAVVFTISVLFTLVVVTMLCRKAILQEKRDIGIFKATGFSTIALRLQFAVRFFITAVLGSFAGIAMSMMFSRKMFSALFRFVGITDFISKFTPYSIILPSTVICLCFFIFSYISSVSIKKIEVRELITE